jgi:hypothetical protein
VIERGSEPRRVAVTEDSAPEIVIERGSEPKKRAPSEPVTSERSVTASGTIVDGTESTNGANGARTKRAGWDD